MPHELVTVSVMVTDPTATPVATPLPETIVAFDRSLEVQKLVPAEASVYVVVPPTNKVEAPDIGAVTTEPIA